MKIENNPSLDKNKFGLVVNNDPSSYKKYMEEKTSRKKINTLERSLHSLENDINNIKDMLEQLLSNKKES